MALPIQSHGMNMESQELKLTPTAQLVDGKYVVWSGQNMMYVDGAPCGHFVAVIREGGRDTVVGGSDLNDGGAGVQPHQSNRFLWFRL